jgi:hypothetical protein
MAYMDPMGMYPSSLSNDIKLGATMSYQEFPNHMIVWER